MILETKQDKSKGCQQVNAIKFEDFVILRNRNKSFKLALENEGFAVYQEEADKSWTKVTKSNDDSIELLKKQEQEHTSQINQLKDRLALEQSKSANLVSLVKHIQEQMQKHTQQLKELSQQLQQPDAQQETNDDSSIHQQPSIVEVEQQPIVEVEVQQTPVSLETTTIQENQSVEETKEVTAQPTIETSGTRTDINKTFAVKGQVQGQDFIVLQCKEQFNIETLPSKIKCRHIRQFFDLVVVDMNLEQRSFMVKLDPKLNNKQSIFVLESN